MATLFGGQDSLGGAIIRLRHAKDSIGYQMTEFATLFPQTVEGTSHSTHRRWVVFPNKNDGIFGSYSGPFTRSQMDAIKRSIEIMRYSAEPCGLLFRDTFILSHCEDRSTSRENIHNGNALTPGYPSEFTWADKKAPLSITDLMAHTAWAEEVLPTKQRVQGWQMGHAGHAYGGITYRYLYGDNSNAAVYHSTLRRRRRPLDYALPAGYIIRALEVGDLDSVRFVNHFIPLFLLPLVNTSTSAYFRSLISLAQADQIYATLPQAEINLNVFAKTLCASNWAQAQLKGTHRESSRTISLACASLFDTGYLDLQIEDLEGVLAISSANSIYASEFLFCDPSHRPPKHHLRHVIGNVGKPGLALLLSPRDTVLREPDLDTWQLVNHATFNGRFEDNFASTTSHLSLTGYEQRLSSSRYGCRDKEAFYLEAVVSAYDKGTWVADLDLLHLAQGPFDRVDASCLHDTSAQQDSSILPGLTSVDNWYEYIDRPPNNAVIRASGNWVARLALAAIPLADKESLIIGSERICWACLMDMESERFPLEERLILC